MEKQTDFPELEGKYIKCKIHKKDKVGDRVVIGCNYYVGITFRTTVKKNGKYTLICVNYTSHLSYDIVFYRLINGIKKGYLIFEGENTNIITTLNPNCPFT